MTYTTPYAALTFKDQIIITACNMAYLPRAQSLVNSVLRNTKNAIWVHLINPDPDYRLPLDSRVIISTEFRKFESAKHEADYCANLRVELLEDALEVPGMEAALWLDADSIVRGDLEEVWTWLARHDAAAVYTAEEPQFRPVEYNHYLISTVGVSNRDFVTCWRRIQDRLRSEPDYRPSIMTVQLAFTRALRSGPWLFKDITYRYSDKFFRQDSPIWEAQGPRKFQDSTYLDEERRYAL